MNRLSGITFLMAVGLCSAVVAEAPVATDRPTFKRIGPPTTEVGKRITIQVDPSTWPPPLPTKQPEGQVESDVEPVAIPFDPGITVYADFWKYLGTNIGSYGASRLLKARDALSLESAVPTPRLNALQRLASDYGPIILRHTANKDVSPALVLAVMYVESAGNPNAVSHAGAAGLMQLMPATAQRFGVIDRSNPDENIKGGVTYLSWLLDEFNGDVVMALAGYNAGENAVKNAGGVPMYDETLGYVPKVVAAWGVARNLCMTPPTLASDGCVFATLASN